MCLFTQRHKAEVFLFTGGKTVRSQAVCVCVFFGGAAECKYVFLVHDQTYAIQRWLAVIAEASDKAVRHRCGRSRHWRSVGEATHTHADSQSV